MTKEALLPILRAEVGICTSAECMPCRLGLPHLPIVYFRSHMSRQNSATVHRQDVYLHSWPALGKTDG